MSSCFICCTTKIVIWQARKNKRTIAYCLSRKKYRAKNEHTFFGLKTDVNNVMKKQLKCIMSVLGKLPPNYLPTLNLTQTLTLTGGQFSSGAIVRIPICLKKSCYSRQLLFSLVFILSHNLRFLLDLINQYYSLFTTKFIYILKAF